MWSQGLWHSRCLCPVSSAAQNGAGGSPCGVLSGSLGLLKCRHCRAVFSFHGRSAIQAGRAAFFFVIANLSLYLITTFPQHSKSVNRTEGNMFEGNIILHILTAALST